MTSYKDLSVKLKVPMMMGIASLAVLALVCLLLLRPLRSGSLENSSRIAQLSAIEAGERVGEKIHGAASVIRAYSGIVEEVAVSTIIPDSLKRSHLLSSLTMLLKNEKGINNIWCIFEPNTFGPDSLYAGKPAHTSAGVFIPWIENGKLNNNVESLADPSLYEIPKRERREILTEPYEYELGGVKRQVFSISIPVVLHGQYLGVIGTDFDVVALNRLIADTNTSGKGKLVTDKGTIVLHYDHSRFGTMAEKGQRNILDRLPDGRMFEGMFMDEGEEIYKVYVPITLAEGVKPWYYAMDSTRAVIFGQARSTAVYLIVYFLISIALISLAGWFLIRPMLKNVSGVTGIIRRLSLGRIDLNIEKSQSRDEFGVMTSELGELVGGLKRTADFAHNIGEGNLNAEYQMLSEHDALGTSLLEMRQSLQKAEQDQAVRTREEEQRNWVTAGLAKFAEILRRDNNNMENLSYNVISNMVKYLGINQGGIFILTDAESDTERLLEMKACYAYDRRKFAEKQIRLGEGLVGTCYLEGETIYMTEIPNKYIAITSGLGDANPSALLISPLKVNDEIFGVIELASFTPFEPYQLDFVQKVSESIAATISTVTVNIRTGRLLEQTKLQAEEMANQEEELRQNMEEMQATQEEMRRREAELQETLGKMEEVQIAGAEKEHEMNQFHKAIFQSNNVIEFSPEAIIVDVNQNLLNLFGTDRSAFVGKHLTAFISEQAYQAANAAMTQSRIYEDVQVVTTATGEKKTIRQRFMPITDRNGKLIKVLMLGFDETMIEEIRQHEEELRQNMEEMQATQEETRRREEELATINFETEQLQNMILATSNVVTLSPDGIINDVNENIVRCFAGKQRNDFIGQSMEGFIGKETLNAAIRSCARGESYSNIQHIPTGPNKITTFNQKFVPIRDRNGVLLRILMVANDETYIEEIRSTVAQMQKMQAVNAEQEHEMKQFQRAIFESNNVVEFDNNSVITAVNSNVLKVFGIPDSSFLVGKHLRDVIGEQGFQAANAHVSRGEIYEDMCEITTAHGQRKTFRQRFIPITDADGRILKVLMLGFDETYIAEMEAKEEEIRQNLEELQTTQEETERREAGFREKSNWYENVINSFNNNPVSVTDMNRNITFLNTAALKILGKNFSEVVGKPCKEVWGVDICGTEHCGIECMMRGINKSTFHAGNRVFTTQASYIKDLQGNNTGYVEVVTEITDMEHNSADGKTKNTENQS